MAETLDFQQEKSRGAKSGMWSECLETCYGSWTMPGSLARMD